MSLCDIRKDFSAFLREKNITQAQLAAVTPLVFFTPKHIRGVFVAPSPISGSGVYASRRFKKGAIIANAVWRGIWTRVGRYTNHSPKPTALVKKTATSIRFVAASSISQDEEITVNYRDVAAAIFNTTMKTFKTEGAHENGARS